MIDKMLVIFFMVGFSLFENVEARPKGNNDHDFNFFHNV